MLLLVELAEVNFCKILKDNVIKGIKSIPKFDFESCLGNNQISIFQEEEEDEVEVEVEATVVVVMGREKQNKCLKNTR